MDDNKARKLSALKEKLVGDSLSTGRMASQEWMPLKLLNESNPVEVAEFVTDLNIVDEPAFAWWVSFVLQKCDRIISAVN